ncbi:hypothetical protein JTF08_08465 [Micrococcaceae bacterium RIT802]|nr:hypothetical protein [Micrococcaceae bacterium RIT 802]
MELPQYLRSLQQAELDLARSYDDVAISQPDDHDSTGLFLALARQGREHARALEPLRARYDATGAGSGDNENTYGDVGQLHRHVPLVELQELYLSACLVDVGWSVLMQVGRRFEDRDLIRVVEHCTSETGKQLAWIKTRIKHASRPALLRPPPHRRRPRPPAVPAGHPQDQP